VPADDASQQCLTRSQMIAQGVESFEELWGATSKASEFRAATPNENETAEFLRNLTQSRNKAVRNIPKAA